MEKQATPIGRELAIAMVYLIKNTITSRGGYEGKLFADL
jgi:hypothetical protein